MTTEAANAARSPRAVTLQHLRTGRVITAPSVAAFARRARLGPYGQYQYDNVLKGYRLHVRGWGLPERLNQRVAVKDVWGNRWEGTVEDLRCRLSATAANRLASGKASGNVLPAHLPVPSDMGKRPVRAVRYTIVKFGLRYSGETLKATGKQIGLSPTSVWMLVHGRVQRTRCGATLGHVKWQRRNALARKSCATA